MPGHLHRREAPGLSVCTTLARTGLRQPVIHFPSLSENVSSSLSLYFKELLGCFCVFILFVNFNVLSILKRFLLGKKKCISFDLKHLVLGKQSSSILSFKTLSTLLKEGLNDTLC